MKGLRWASERLADAIWWHKGFGALAKLADVADAGLTETLRSLRELLGGIEEGKRTFLAPGVYCIRKAELDRLRAGLEPSASAASLKTARETLADIDRAFETEADAMDPPDEIPF